jgi:hypothetical protein
LPHGKPVPTSKSFAEKALLEIFNQNWQGIVDGNKMQGITVPPMSNEDIVKARKGNLSFLTTLDNGTPIFPMGGGIATDGSNPQITAKADQLVRDLRELEKEIKDKAEQFLSDLKLKRGLVYRSLKVSLQETTNGLEVIETQSGHSFATLSPI